MICPKCGAKMKIVVIYNFGDPAMGVNDNFWQCPKCWQRKPLEFTQDGKITEE